MRLHVRTRVAITQALTQSCTDHYQVLIMPRGMPAARSLRSHGYAQDTYKHTHTHIHVRTTHARIQISRWRRSIFMRLSVRLHVNPVGRLVDTVYRIRLIPRRWPRISLRMQNLNRARLRNTMIERSIEYLWWRMPRYVHVTRIYVHFSTGRFLPL